MKTMHHKLLDSITSQIETMCQLFTDNRALVKQLLELTASNNSATHNAHQQFKMTEQYQQETFKAKTALSNSMLLVTELSNKVASFQSRFRLMPHQFVLDTQSKSSACYLCIMPQHDNIHAIDHEDKK